MKADVIRLEVTSNAIRWCSNIIVEVLGNHGEVLPDDARDALKEAVVSFGKADKLIGKALDTYLNSSKDKK